MIMSSYVYGNTVRKEPKMIPANPVREKKEVSRQVQQNRNKALHMSKGYVVFLAVAAFVALFACVKYLQLQSEVTSRSKNIATLQKELAAVKEENTTRYNVIVTSMNLEEIRNKAINELGMVYATEEQIVEYKNPTSNVVTQYAEIPKSGVVASSDYIK